jgi:DNA replication protein DnaC
MTTASELNPNAREVELQCGKHGAYLAKQFKITNTGGWMGGHCPKCSEEQAARDAEQKRKAEELKHQQRIEYLLQRSGIPKRFQERTLEGYEITNEGQRKAHRICTWFVETWHERIQQGTCLIFSGMPGTGKTHLATAIANDIIRKGYSAYFSTIGDAIRSIQATYDRDSTIPTSQAIDALVAPSLLILDEIQIQTGSDHDRRLMFDIINKRYENVRSTIVMSNLAPEPLKEYLGDRVLDRLREGGGKMVAFDWGSHRV